MKKEDEFSFIVKNEKIQVENRMRLILSDYYEKLDIDPTVETEDFKPENVLGVLVGYEVLLNEVLSGGYSQLIRNGYGDYIFSSYYFISNLKKWGAEKLAANIEKARKIFFDDNIDFVLDLEYGEKFEIRRTFNNFKFVDKEFCAVAVGETEKINLYIEKNLNQFPTVF